MEVHRNGPSMVKLSKGVFIILECSYCWKVLGVNVYCHFFVEVIISTKRRHNAERSSAILQHCLTRYWGIETL